ncbi:MAG: hypothetical protein RBR02_11155 [Desulfuromonadaceae bacterium]|nr:hypothetical protein [Desulfuromonadaceae bacterium]
MRSCSRGCMAMRHAPKRAACGTVVARIAARDVVGVWFSWRSSPVA